jgi:hypothetical protein
MLALPTEMEAPVNEDWSEDSEEVEDGSLASGGGIRFYGGTYYIHGKRISLSNHPECLDAKTLCLYCDFFDPTSCPLLMDEILRQDLTTLLGIDRENREAQLERQRTLVGAIRHELEAHGRPLHYEVLARMVAERHPKLRVTESSVLRIMSQHTGEFECVGTGVYKCK